MTAYEHLTTKYMYWRIHFENQNRKLVRCISGFIGELHMLSGHYSQPSTYRPYMPDTCKPYPTLSTTNRISSQRLDLEESLSQSVTATSTVAPRGSSEEWRKHPPYSERHLTKHSNSKASAFSRLATSSRQRQQPPNTPAVGRLSLLVN